jgi:hypothetical protein
MTAPAMVKFMAMEMTDSKLAQEITEIPRGNPGHLSYTSSGKA